MARSKKRCECGRNKSETSLRCARCVKEIESSVPHKVSRAGTYSSDAEGHAQRIEALARRAAIRVALFPLDVTEVYGG